METLFEGTVLNWMLVLLAAFVIGLSKAGIKGIDMLNVTLMALVFGGKASTGIVLPLLCVADVMAVRYYHRHAEWPHFRKLLPWIVAGILVGVLVGKGLDEATFRKIMAAIILVTVSLMLLTELREKLSFSHHPLFASGMGLATGFTTMLGNLAGAFSNLYFLALRMPKNNFIGTAAWLFLFINLFKLPFQVLVWKNISGATLWIDLLLLPALVLGFVAGIKLVAKISDDRYRKVVIILTLIGAFLIFFKR
jgi:uncharacterized membrane protein YfcA